MATIAQTKDLGPPTATQRTQDPMGRQSTPNSVPIFALYSPRVLRCESNKQVSVRYKFSCEPQNVD